MQDVPPIPRPCKITVWLRPVDREVLARRAAERNQTLRSLLSDIIESTAAQERRPLERCHITRLDAFARLDKRVLPKSPEE